jgi:hypothetical protein
VVAALRAPLAIGEPTPFLVAGPAEAATSCARLPAVVVVRLAATLIWRAERITLGYPTLDAGGPPRPTLRCQVGTGPAAACTRRSATRAASCAEMAWHTYRATPAVIKGTRDRLIYLCNDTTPL